MALDAGAAFIDVEGKLDGLQHMLETQGLGLFTGFASHIGTIMAAALPVAIGVGLFKIGDTFDTQFDKIRVGTGKTGKALDGLEESFKNVAKTTPADFAQIGDAITGVNVKLGLTGTPLEKMSQQLLNLSRITKTDLASNVAVVTGLFNNWNIATADQGMRLDELYRTGQKTGVGVQTLGETMSKGGAVLRTLGFDYEHSAALVGILSKNGLDATPILMGFGKSIATMAKAGETFPDTFRRIVGGIQTAKDPVAATAEAIHLFGARAGPKLAELIRAGKFSIDDLAKSIAGGRDTINQSAKDTEHFSEKWKLFSNRLLVDVEPIAVWVFRSVGKAMDALGPIMGKVEGWVKPLVKIFGKEGIAGVAKELEDQFLHLSTPMKILTGVAVALGIALWAAFSPVTLIIVALAALGYGIYYAYTHFATFRAVVDAVTQFLTETVWPAIKQFAEFIAAQFEHLVAWTRKHWAAISEAIGHVWVVIQTIVRIGIAYLVKLWDTFGGSIISAVKAAFTAVQEVIRAAVKIISNLFSFFIDLINGDWGKAWNDLLGVVSGAWDWIFAFLRFAWSILSAIFGAALNSLGVLWDTAWSALGAVVSAIWGGITGAVSAGLNFVWGIVKGVGQTISDAWSAIWGGFIGVVTGIIDGVLGAAKSLINGVIGVLNAGIGFINDNLQIHISVDDPTGITNGVHFNWDGPHIPKIPKIHSGTGQRGFQPQNGADEGLAVLQRGEIVTAKNRTATAGGPAVHIENMQVWNAREAAQAIAREQAWAELTAAR